MLLKKICLLSIAVGTLSACGSTPTWEKAGATMDERDNLISKCRYQIGINKVDEDEREALLSDCLRAEGYRLVEKD
ncbi:hypothetical protein [Geopseudomonas aromaticivorans]